MWKLNFLFRLFSTADILQNTQNVKRPKLLTLVSNTCSVTATWYHCYRVSGFDSNSRLQILYACIQHWKTFDKDTDFVKNNYAFANFAVKFIGIIIYSSSSSSSSIGTTAHCGLWLVEQVLPFFPICHQLSPSSHSQHLEISFYFLFPSFPGSSPSSLPFQFLSEDLFGHPILLHCR